MAAETQAWQVVVESVAEVLIEVEAETQEQAERYAVEHAREGIAEDRWEYLQGMTATHAWRKSDHDVTSVAEQPWD